MTCGDGSSARGRFLALGGVAATATATASATAAISTSSPLSLAVACVATPAALSDMVLGIPVKLAKVVNAWRTAQVRVVGKDDAKREVELEMDDCGKT